MGTMYIFTFGGFMGLTMGLLLKIREKKEKQHTFKHRNYTAN
jgi:nitrate/nitrite transporter NarK